MSRNKSLIEKLLEIIIFIMFITSIILIVIYFYKYYIDKDNKLFIYITISLFILGITTLVYIFKYGYDEENYNNYIILKKEDYEHLKKELENNKKIIKSQESSLNKIKNIIKNN